MDSSCDLKKTLSIAIASDLHATSKSGAQAPSFCFSNDTSGSPISNPLIGLQTLIEKYHLSSDLLVCPGDLADKAEPAAIKYAWGQLQEIGKKLCVTRVLATAGNHDVDSRHQHNDFDAKGVLQALEPRFPLSENDGFDRFWSRHFVLLEESDWRMIILNSSAFHGANDWTDTKGNAYSEQDFGRISTHTLLAIETELKCSRARPLNVLLCHHHPHQHSEIGLGENDVMKGGQLLLEMLGSGNYGQWLVIHGHKHHPKIAYASGISASSPVVFAAGSLSACLYPTLATLVRNQFYILDFDLDQIDSFGLVGRFRAWDWAVGQGWLPAGERSGLPAKGGFGCREPHQVIAREIVKYAIGPSILWDSICNSYPKARFLLPRDESLLETTPGSEHGRRFLRDAHGNIERMESLGE